MFYDEAIAILQTGNVVPNFLREQAKRVVQIQRILDERGFSRRMGDLPSLTPTQRETINLALVARLAIACRRVGSPLNWLVQPEPEEELVRQQIKQLLRTEPV